MENKIAKKVNSKIESTMKYILKMIIEDIKKKHENIEIGEKELLEKIMK